MLGGVISGHCIAEDKLDNISINTQTRTSSSSSKLGESSSKKALDEHIFA